MGRRGRLYIVDRKKDMIITGGENVYSRGRGGPLPAPAVAEVAVVGVPDAHLGREHRGRGTARAGTEATPEELIDHCRFQLAGYKKPKIVVFRARTATASGKILKRDLRDELRDQLRSTPRPDTTASFVASGGRRRGIVGWPTMRAPTRRTMPSADLRQMI